MPPTSNHIQISNQIGRASIFHQNYCILKIPECKLGKASLELGGGGSALIYFFVKQRTQLSGYSPRNPTKASLMTTSKLAYPLLKDKYIEFIFDGYI